MQRHHRLVEDEVELKLCIRRRLVELEFLIPKQLEFHRRARFMEKMERGGPLSSCSPAVGAEGKAGDVLELRRRNESPAPRPPISCSAPPMLSVWEEEGQRKKGKRRCGKKWPLTQAQEFEGVKWTYP
uniref:Uncharacterized protein n=1 Tax=Oryza rufipogon TaxID=4529 RepID=A0A0E0PK92_ORYRU